MSFPGPDILYTKSNVRFGAQRGEMSSGHFSGSNPVASMLHVQGFRDSKPLFFYIHF